MAGLAIQPFLAAIVAFFAFPVFLLDRNGETLAGGHPYDSTDAAASVAFGTGLVALFMTIAAVLPTALWLTRRFQLSLRDALLFGLGFGNLPYVLFAVATGGTYGIAGLVRGVTFSSMLGLVGATVFWAIALRRQGAPDMRNAVGV
jgi:hypothetical protein